MKATQNSVHRLCENFDHPGRHVWPPRVGRIGPWAGGGSAQMANPLADIDHRRVPVLHTVSGSVCAVLAIQCYKRGLI